MQAFADAFWAALTPFAAPAAGFAVIVVFIGAFALLERLER